MPLLFPELFLDQFELAVEHPFLSERGIKKETAQRWQIGFDPEENAIIVPVRDAWNNCVGIVRRHVDGTVPKYRYNPGFEVKSSLVGLHNPMGGRRDKIYLVEGPLDAILMSQYLGFAVAVLGSHLHQQQINMLEFAGYQNAQYFVMFDNDKAGQEGAARAESLLCRAGFSALEFPFSKKWADPAEMIRDIENKGGVGK